MGLVGFSFPWLHIDYTIFSCSCQVKSLLRSLHLVWADVDRPYASIRTLSLLKRLVFLSPDTFIVPHLAVLVKLRLCKLGNHLGGCPKFLSPPDIYNYSTEPLFRQVKKWWIWLDVNLPQHKFNKRRDGLKCPSSLSEFPFLPWCVPCTWWASAVHPQTAHSNHTFSDR